MACGMACSSFIQFNSNSSYIQFGQQFLSGTVLDSRVSEVSRLSSWANVIYPLRSKVVSHHALNLATSPQHQTHVSPLPHDSDVQYW